MRISHVVRTPVGELGLRTGVMLTETPLMFPIVHRHFFRRQEGRIEIVRYLIGQGWVRPPFKSDDDGRDPLFEANQKGHSEIVSYLAKHGGR